MIFMVKLFVTLFVVGAIGQRVMPEDSEVIRPLFCLALVVGALGLVGQALLFMWVEL